MSVGLLMAEWLVVVLVTLAAVLQTSSARIPTAVPIVAAGRAVLAGGWLLAAVWAWWRLGAGGWLDMPPLALLWVGLTAFGTVCVTLNRIHYELPPARDMELD